LRQKIERDELTATDDAYMVASEVLNRMRRRPNFGNRGDLETLLDRAKVRHITRPRYSTVAFYELHETSISTSRGLPETTSNGMIYSKTSSGLTTSLASCKGIRRWRIRYASARSIQSYIPHLWFLQGLFMPLRNRVAAADIVG
jgi:hypothetical protein